MATGSSVEAFAADFEASRAHLAGAGLPWLDALRRGAMDALASGGFPGQRDEDWKYTSAATVLKERLATCASASPQDTARAQALLAALPDLGEASALLVLVDGRFHAGLSRLGSVRGLRAGSLREALSGRGDASADSGDARLQAALATDAAAGRGFAALNAALFEDGAVLQVSAGSVLDAPIHLVHLSLAGSIAAAAHPRNLVLLGDGAQATLVEHYAGEAGHRGLANPTTIISLEHGAGLRHVRLQREAPSAFHVGRVSVEQAAGSSYSSLALGLGARLSRVELAVRLDGEDAECSLSGLYAMDARRHADHHLAIEHARPRTRSAQHYKGVLEDESRGVFTGKVVVAPGSAKIRATQSSASLLLGAGAIADARPQLEILADDVACNHGATIGRLDDESLFYLYSRGIDPREARRMLVAGFAAEVVEAVEPESLREALVALVGDEMGRLGGTSGGGAGDGGDAARAGAGVPAGGASA